MKTLSIRALAHIETTPKKVELLKKALTLYNTREEWSLELFKEDTKRRLYIPRALVAGEADDAGWEKINVRNKIRLRSAQKYLVSELFKYLEKNPKGAILHAGTGTGKTIMGLDVALKLGYKTLVIVPTERIFKQWIQSIKDFTNIKQVGLIRGSLCQYQSPITVAMLQTIRKDRFSHLEKEFGTVIFDEVHTISTQHFNTVASKFWSRTRIGLSATPRRKDGMQNIFFWHIGKIGVSYSKVDAKPRIVTVEYYDPRTTTKGCIFDNSILLGRYYNKLASNSRRNALIASLARGAYNKGYDVLVLSERVRHLHTLKEMSKIPPEDCGLLTKDIKEIDRKVIFGTYGSAGLGFDLPRLSCVIFAIPRADIEQPAGRVLRSKSKKPVIVDIVDICSDVMRGWYKKRRKYYEKIADEFIKYGAGYD
jgi:superfamily II DNA or RNA helicase